MSEFLSSTNISRVDTQADGSTQLSHVVGPVLTDLWRLERCVGDVLQNAAQKFPSQEIVYIDDHGEEMSSSYFELLATAETIAAGLHKAGFRVGDKLIVQTARSSTTIPLLWACLLSGVVAVPTPALTVLDEGAAPVRKLRAVWEMLNGPAIATDADIADKLAGFGSEHGWDGLRVISFDTLNDATAKQHAPALPKLSPDTLAMLPLTSGSTGRPKAVELTHRNILAMSAGTNQANGFTVEDVALNWMPLDHPGALVFLGVVPMDVGAAQIHVPTGYVLGDPLRWLDLIDRYRASISWAPNFAFALINTRLGEGKKQYDLSCMRFLVSAGEQVTATTVQLFLEKMQRNGLPKDALRPAFGMAETCSGITWSPGLTKKILAEDPTYVSLGPVIPGAEMRITDEENNVLPVGETGALQLRGPSVLAGYYENPTVNADVMRGNGWFATGDLAFFKNKELYITGRSSEVIMINGLNVAANELEAVSEDVEGVAVSFSAALSVRNETTATEDVVLVFSPQSGDPSDKETLTSLADQIRSYMARQTGIRLAKLVALPTSEIPKTSIGKIQRSALKKRFLNGDFDHAILAEKPRKRRRPAPTDDTPAHTQDQIAELEEKITALWSEALDIDDIDPGESFFELGGNSILLMRLQALLRPIAPTIELVDLFQYPTIRSQALFVARRDSDDGDNNQTLSSKKVRQNTARDVDTDIAIIGMSCRFPGADNIAEFWENLRQGKETISRFSVDELVEAGFDREQVSHPDYVRASPTLRDPAGFDAGFFGYSAREAELLDPQQRLLLHCAWETFEDAAYNPLTLKGRVGAFVGASMNTYFVNNVLPNRNRLDSRDPMDVFTLDSMGGFQTMVANDKDYVSTRVSYKLDLRGPSLNVQTACSTGLVVIHLGAKSLMNGECEMALAATSSVQAPQAAGHLWQEGMIVSPDGHCRAFDADAGGTIFGSGVGVVLLKPLRKAVEDGDNIYAVIRGSALNNDGGQKVGYMAPSGIGETDVARAALAAADIDPETVGFLEAHGTGTRVGDPIEARSLAKAYRGNGKAKQWCALGSVKTNLGHLQISSGIAGFMKAALALHHQEIPPTLHFNNANPDCEFENSPFHVNTQTISWPENAGHPRRAGVNSLGIGGTNAHIVLEEAPAPTTQKYAETPDRSWHILVLAARDEKALDRLQARYLNFVAAHREVDPADLAYSANAGRKAFEQRRFFVYDTLTTLRDKLAEPAIRTDGKSTFLALSHMPITNAPGKDLLKSAPVFTHLLEDYDEVIIDSGRDSVLTWLRDRIAKPDDLSFDLLAGVTIQLALAGTMRSWGLPMRAFTGDPDMLAVLAGKQDFAVLVKKLLSDASGKPSVSIPSNDEARYIPLIVETETGTGDLWPRMLMLLGQMVVAGYAIEWEKFDAPFARHRLSLPTYPFDTKRYWLEPPKRRAQTAQPARPPRNTGTLHPLVNSTFTTPASTERFYIADYHPDRLSLLGDHLINGVIVVSGACHMSMLLGTVGDLPGTEISDVRFERPLIVPDNGIEAHLVIHAANQDGVASFALACTHSNGDAQSHIQGKIGRLSEGVAAASNIENCPDAVNSDDYDRILAAKKITLGPSYRWASNIRCGGTQATCTLKLPDGLNPSEAKAYVFHPGLLDGCFGLMIAATADKVSTSGTFVPAGFDRMVIHHVPQPDASLTATGQFETASDGKSAKGTIHLIAADGTPILTIEGLVGRAVDLAAITAPIKAAASLTGLYRIDWQETKAPSETIKTAAVLILTSDNHQKFAKDFKAELTKAGYDTQLIAPTADKNDIEAAINNALATDANGIVEILDCRSNLPEVLDGLQALIALESDCAGKVRISLLQDAALPESAGMTGLAKVFGLEHPAIACRTIHLDLTLPTSTNAAQLVTVIREPLDGDGEIDFTTGTRRCPQLVRLDAKTDTDLRCKADGTYVLSGASGALGSTLLGWLMDSGAGTIVALSRSGKLDPDIAQQAKDKKINLVNIAADITKPITLPGGLPPIRGVIHLAGILDDATLLKAKKAQFANVIAPKLDGARNLSTLTKDANLDFFVMFSSAASVIGNRGQAAYAAANAMLDAYAAQLRTTGVAATSISWGPWAGDGMANRSARTSATFERLGIHSLSADQAISLLNAAMASDTAHVSAIDCDWATFVSRTKEQGGRIDEPFFAHVLPEKKARTEPQNAPAATSAPLIDLLKQADPSERKSILHNFVHARVVDALSFAGIATIEPDQALMDQGLDSLGSVGLRNDLNDALAKTFPVGLFFEYPTLNQLVAYLHSVIQDELGDNGEAAGTDNYSAADSYDEDIYSALDDMDITALNELVKQELDG
ncbi:beta-ketoacyl synthase N-terminal-like domain-containing protein [uncultured Thalassospira sp.]|mgnify:FL=1|uniref:beta-ketoacyl synthase N-terminal-like domain-containing protein n=1 Tax=uncultured Thalassospira sp. TaxID=404382 RepID=UPI0030DB4EA1